MIFVLFVLFAFAHCLYNTIMYFENFVQLFFMITISLIYLFTDSTFQNFRFVLYSVTEIKLKKYINK